jgi:NTP pyrophosphatase (non-canonical NTP hydrolase)
MEFKQFQKLMHDLYFHQDNQRGINKTFMWLVEEVGELSTALRDESLDKQKISEEMADIVAWISSLANLLKINLDEAIFNKYSDKCPKCKQNPCQCG